MSDFFALFGLFLILKLFTLHSTYLLKLIVFSRRFYLYSIFHGLRSIEINHVLKWCKAVSYYQGCPQLESSYPFCLMSDTVFVLFVSSVIVRRCSKLLALLPEFLSTCIVFGKLDPHPFLSASN